MDAIDVGVFADRPENGLLEDGSTGVFEAGFVAGFGENRFPAAGFEDVKFPKVCDVSETLGVSEGVPKTDLEG